MKNKKEKTTVLFVSKTADGLKPLQVSTSLLRNWKKYFAAVIILFFGLISAVIFLLSNDLQQQKIEVALSNKIHSIRNKFHQTDTAAIKKKLVKIDTQLSDINKFLKARGISTAGLEPQGGEEDDAMLSADEAIDFYDSYLKKVSYNISYTPLGYPFTGRITSTFGHRENPFGGASVETHKGLDIKGPNGAPVKAMANGKVIFAGVRGGYGNCVILKHGNGFQTLYGHLSKILVSVGNNIKIGQHIGNIGSTGRSTGPHLHYEVRRNGQQINPEPFLNLN
jgi:murein DD-endopeptidase MepM/ murein hydrolase activator NlpD